jgi:sugar-specific transcriptional regulator TrmB
MISQVRYQVFVSSTYEDLREERQQATQAVLETSCFPSGMELFPASDDTQWELIKRVIEESDYYVVIVAGRYGSLGAEGISYTEMEYDYAIERGIPVLGFVRENVGEIPSHYTEQTEEGRKKLDAFRHKVMSRSCRKYSTASELGMAVMKSLMAEARIRPRIGWVRSDQARSAEDDQRERELRDELNEAKKYTEHLERTLRDRAVLVDELPRDQLAQGDDIVEITITFADNSKTVVSKNIGLTWDEIFKVIGATMYGYIMRRREKGYNQEPTYPFQDNLEDHIRAKIIDQVQNRKIKIQQSQIDAYPSPGKTGS